MRWRRGRPPRLPVAGLHGGPLLPRGGAAGARAGRGHGVHRARAGPGGAARGRGAKD